MVPGSPRNDYHCRSWPRAATGGPQSVCVRAKSLQSCLTLGNSMDCSPPGSSVHGILQARLLEWVTTPSPGVLPDPGIEPVSLTFPALAGGLFTTSATWEALYLCLVAQPCPTLRPMDCSPPCSSVHGDSPGKDSGQGCHFLLQGIFSTRDWTWVSCTVGGSFTKWATREALVNAI